MSESVDHQYCESKNMQRKFCLFVIFFLFTLFPLTMMNKSNAVSMVWNYVGTGCFQYNTYHQIAATTKESCLDRCQNDVRCAFVVYRKHKCALCTEEYKPKASCLHDVELIAKDFNECAVRADDCEENAVCINTPGSFKCRCKAGYYNKAGKKCIEVPHVDWRSYKDSCLEVSSPFAVIEISNVKQCKLKCQISDYCAMVEYRPGDKKCRMAKDRKFKPVPSCVSRTDLFVKVIIECDNERKRCPRYAYCQAKENHRLCRCRFGYRGNGKNCHDVNECDTYKNLCGQHAKCHNTIGSYRCVCLSGYHGDGQLCRKVRPNKEGNKHGEKSDKGTLNTIINLFNHSGSHHFLASSQVLVFIALVTSLL